MRLAKFILLFNLLTTTVAAQITITGTVLDYSTSEPLIGATVVYGKGKGTLTDLDGNFSFQIISGKRSVEVSYIGYKAESRLLEVGTQNLDLSFRLKTKLLKEVQVVADIAKDRQTPVAFTSIPIKKVNEELASQEIPMLLNSTPGVYATEQGENGSPRVTIRGFNQRNIAVLIDGIPVNDMENGKVYWSNWFGLDAILSNIQVQRGLGASKIAVPSVGGTINYFTKGTGNKRSVLVKQEISSTGYFRTSAGYNSGRLNNDWGFTLAGSFKTGNGYVDYTPTEGYFYYAKLQKRLGNHNLSLSAMGAPQRHGQRTFKNNIPFYDSKYANSLGINDSIYEYSLVDFGASHNKHWGLIDRWELDSNGDTIHNPQELNERQNYYHKPKFSLRDFWKVNEKLHISNVLYMSIGKGGGVGLSAQEGSRNAYLSVDKLTGDGYINFQSIYDANHSGFAGGTPTSSTVLAAMVNNHYWYGWLSTTDYKLNKKSKFTGGVDLRYYKGEHYKEVYDLLGGVYMVVPAGERKNQNDVGDDINKKVGDKFGWHNDGLVKWSSVFAQYEYTASSLSAFASVSGTNTAYKRVDYFYLPEDQETDWKWIRGYSMKSGLNKNLDEYNNVFINLGHINKAPRFNNVYYYDNTLYKLIKNERVYAAEGGYSFRSTNFSANANIYYTVWENKPKEKGVQIEIDGDRYRANVNGMDALHKGIELDFAYKPQYNITIEGLVSLGDWRWNSNETIFFTDENNQPLIDPETGEQAVRSFYAKGVHVADAAQNQFGMSLRYEPIKPMFIKLKAIYFGKNYAEFDPISLDLARAGKESWKLPDYQIFNLHAGYKFRMFKASQLYLNFGVLNLFDQMYISDAQNNDNYSGKYQDENGQLNAVYQDFDAKSSGVFFGYGRRYNLSLTYKF